jgi:hypothetical protein
MAKHKYVETPEKMWELFEEYRNEVKSNPRKKHVFVGKDGNSDFEMLERPLTMEGFWNYARKTIGCIHDYFANTNDAYSDYSSICRAIREEIRQDQIEGGMVGQYNPSITQRLNGLVDKQENNIKVEKEIFNSIDLDVKENDRSN